jgi:hypothetical protein
MNGLPGLRLLPDAPRPGRSHRTHQPRRQTQPEAGRGTRQHLAAFHTGYQQHREPQPTDPQNHQDPRPLPRRTSRDQTHLPRDPPIRTQMADRLQLDQRTTRPQDPLRRPTARLTTINQRPRPHTQKLGHPPPPAARARRRARHDRPRARARASASPPPGCLLNGAVQRSSSARRRARRNPCVRRARPPQPPLGSGRLGHPAIPPR